MKTMIKAGQVIDIPNYDRDSGDLHYIKYRVLEVVSPFVVLCEHIKAHYKTCFSFFELSQYGYLPKVPDRKERKTWKGKGIN